MEINPNELQTGTSKMIAPSLARSFGEILIERGLVSETELGRCLEIQKTRSKNGIFSRLGAILIEQQALTAEEVAAVLEEQQLTILACGKCFTQFNVQAYKPGINFQCQRCSGSLVMPADLNHVDVEDTVAATSVLTQSGRNRRRPTRSAGEAIAQLGDYEILGEIARGGMSIVYKARQPGLDRLIAIKVLLELANAADEQVDSFANEARAISRLRHPNIIGIFEYGSTEGVHYYTMDYIEGTTLDRAIVLEGLNHEAIAEIFRKLGEALSYAHSRQIIHRDIKPRNIMIDRYGEPIIIDFGIAKPVGQNDSIEADLIGSPAYLAPEYIERRNPYDAPCEVYALGASLYQILSGRHPHDAADTQRILESIKSKPPLDLQKIVPSVPSDLARITMAALNFNRNDRYPNPAELTQDLRRFLEGEEVLINGSPLYKIWRRQRTKLLVLFVIFMAGVLVFMSGYYTRTASKNLDVERAITADRDRWKLRWIYSSLDLAKAQFAEGKYKRAQDTLKLILTSTSNPPSDVLRLISEIEREIKRRK